MFEALDRVMNAKEGRLAHLRDIFHGSLRPQFAAGGSMPLSLPWLNAAQEAAVGEALKARDVMVVHGPPGTGKTTTLIEAVCETLRREPQVLVCAQSNTAVDWISEQLANRGLSVLRIGNPTRVTDAMLQNTYERRFEAHPDYPALWQTRRTIRQLYSQPRKGRPANFHQKIARLKERADELEIRIRHALFDGCRVVAATGRNGQPRAHRPSFPHALHRRSGAGPGSGLLDCPAKADRVILAGDHCQLPPTVKSQAAMKGGLAVTLMEHVAETRPECVRLLTLQYRMNETLMRFSSDWFYGGQLKAAPEVSHRSMLDELDWPLVWVDTDEMPALKNEVDEGEGTVDYHEAFVAASYGRINKAEAQLTINTLKAYVERVGRHRLLEERADIGIISPYKAQVQYLRSLIRRESFLRPLASQITVNTVDAFQGQERDIVLVSMVRANERTNRFPFRPPPHERGHHQSENETDYSRFVVNPRPPRFLSRPLRTLPQSGNAQRKGKRTGERIRHYI